MGAVLDRSYVSAIPELRAALELNPDYAIAHVRLALAYALSGQRDEASRQVRAALPVAASSLPMQAEIASVAALAGDRATARGLLARLEERSRQTYLSSYRLALVHLALGENQEAITLLDQASQQRDIGMVWLAIEPRLDPLRGDPRFQDLMRRMRLPALAPPPPSR